MASTPGASKPATSTAPTAFSPNCAAIPRRSAPPGTSGSPLRRPRVQLVEASKTRSVLAGGPGFEPRLTGSEPVVLPLNYPPNGPAAVEAAGCSDAGGGWQAAVALRFRGRWRGWGG